MPFPINTIHRLGLEQGAGIARRATQDALGASTSASVAATYGGATVAGNLLIATVYTGNASIPAITGWTLAGSIGINASTAQLAIFYKIATGSETTITATAASSLLMRIHIYEYANIYGSTGFVDVAAITLGNTTNNLTNLQTATLQTINAGDLVFATTGFNGDSSAPAYDGLTLRQSDSRLIDGDGLFGVEAVTANARWTSTLKASSIIIAFRARTTPVDLLLLEDNTSKVVLDETVALDDPLPNATGIGLTPTFTFSGEDVEDQSTLHYEVQIDTVSTFDSQ